MELFADNVGLESESRCSSLLLSPVCLIPTALPSSHSSHLHPPLTSPFLLSLSLSHSPCSYINHVEDSNLFIGVSVGGHDLNADPQEMKHRTYYLSNG